MMCPNIGTEYCGVCEAAPHCRELLALREGEDSCEFCGNPACEGECEYCFEDDGQPSEYDEWQDYMGGDDWDHGQFDSYDEY